MPIITLAPVVPINRALLFDKVRKPLFSGILKAKQVQGIEAILNEWERQQLTDRRMLAYMLATAFHETAETMQPIKEFSRGKGLDYGKKLKMGGGPNKRIAYTIPNQIYYGRGLVQLTWYENYKLMGRLLGIDLLNNPDLALQMDVSVQIMFEGMMQAASSFGDFTGRCLEQYFTKKTCDWVNARKIINGLDCAEKIANHAMIFNSALAA
jgi:putative chitinase